MTKERQCFKNRGTDTSKLDKFITKMTLFTFIFVFSMGLIIACDFYHFTILQKWYPTTTNCKVTGGADRGFCRRAQQPEPIVYVVRTLSSILLGTTTSIWMFSSKTIKAWKDFICCGYCSSPKTEKFQTTLLQNTVQQNFTQNPDFGRLQRNPQNAQYLPLSVMTNSGNSGGISITYAGNPDQWKASKIV